MFEARLNRRQAVILESADLHQGLKSIQGELKELTPQSRNYPLRIASLAVAIFVITTIILQANGISWKALPGRIKQLMQTSVSWKTGIILGSIGLLISGSAFIIYRVTRGKGKFWGDSHYQPIVLKQARIPGRERIHWDQKMQPHEQLIDTSLLENGTGITNSVERKKDEHDLISFSTLIIAPIQTVAAVAYNVIRFCVIPFYIIGRMAQEGLTGKAAYEGQRKFKLIDIPKQMGLSLYWAARAPFYGVAYIVATLYSFIDPMGGRKLGQLVTHEWMEGVDRLESVWTCRAVDGHNWEGGGGPEKLGHQAYYWTGCWMPWATVEMNNHNVTRAYYPGEIFEYDIYLPGEVGLAIPGLVEDPETTSIYPPLHNAQRLTPGHYRYVKYDDKLFLTAHVTKRDGQRVFIWKIISEKPESVDEVLNQAVQRDAADPDVKLGERIILGERMILPRTHGKKITLQEGQKPASFIRPNGEEYVYIKSGADVFYVDSNTTRKIAITDRFSKQRKDLYLKAITKENVLELASGEWQKISVRDKVYIIAHKQNEWGEELFITKQVLKGDDIADINQYLDSSLKGSIETDLFGAETGRSLQRRQSLKVILRDPNL